MLFSQEKKLDDAVDEVERIRKTMRDTAGQIAKKIYLDLYSYVQKDVPREFAAIAQNESSQIKFGMGKMLSLAGAVIGKNDEKIKEIYQPFMDSIEGYIKTKLADWKDRVPTLIDSDLRDLEAELNAQFSDFDMNLEEAANLFAYGNTKAPNTKGMSFKTGLQNALALSNWDVSLAVENTASGGMSWMDFGKRAAAQLGIDLGITLIFGAPFLAVALPIEVVSMMIKSKKMSKDIIISVGDTAFAALTKRVGGMEADFEEKIIDGYVEKGEQAAATAIRLVNDQQQKMDKLLHENKMSDAEMMAENERADSTLVQMRGCINAIYKELYGNEPSDAEFLNLAKNEKKK